VSFVLRASWRAPPAAVGAPEAPAAGGAPASGSSPFTVCPGLAEAAATLCSIVVMMAVLAGAGTPAWRSTIVSARPTASVIEAVMLWEKTATRSATPRTKPICRAQLITPEPAPPAWCGTALMPAIASDGMAKPSPAPSSSVRQETSQRVAVGSNWRRSRRPAAMASIPTAAGTRGETWSSNFPTSGASKAPRAGMGVTATAASSSE